MLKKTMTYETFDGDFVTEDFYFNLTKAELTEMQLSEKKGFAEYLSEIVASNDGKLIIQNFKDIILKAYGQRTADGRSFEKTEAMRTWFAGTQAYSTLFMELATEAEKAAEFINGVVPKDMAPNGALTATDEGPKGPAEKEFKDFTREELVAMPQEQFDKLVGTTNPQSMTQTELVIAMERKNRQ